MSTSTLTPDEQFFFDHAGWSHNPKTETSEEGHIRCAVALAAAERRLMVHANAWCEWAEDTDGVSDLRTDRETYTTCECACIRIDGIVVASLGCIVDATDDYRRVFRAELALEAFPEEKTQ